MSASLAAPYIMRQLGYNDWAPVHVATKISRAEGKTLCGRTIEMPQLMRDTKGTYGEDIMCKSCRRLSEAAV